MAPFESESASTCGFNWTYSLDTSNKDIKIEEYVKLVSTDLPSITLSAPDDAAAVTIELIVQATLVTQSGNITYESPVNIIYEAAEVLTVVNLKPDFENKLLPTYAFDLGKKGLVTSVRLGKIVDAEENTFTCAFKSNANAAFV